MNEKNYKITKSRSIMYKFNYPRYFDHKAEADVCDLLENSDEVFEWYCKNGSCWFEGFPGKNLRSVRDKVKNILRDSRRRYE